MYTSLLDLIENEALPAGLELSEDLSVELMGALRGTVYELVQDLEILVPVLQNAIVSGDPANIIDAILQFLGTYAWSRAEGMAQQIL